MRNIIFLWRAFWNLSDENKASSDVWNWQIENQGIKFFFLTIRPPFAREAMDYASLDTS